MITDPSFRRVPIRGVYTKSPTIDRRFKWVLYIKASSAPVDKRGKRIRRDNDFLKEYYRIGQEVDDEKKQNSEEDPSGDDEQSEAEQNLMALKAEEKQSKSEKKLAMNSDEEESDDDDDDESAESHDQEEEASEEVFEEDDEAALHEDSEPEIPVKDNWFSTLFVFFFLISIMFWFYHITYEDGWMDGWMILCRKRRR